MARGQGTEGGEEEMCMAGVEAEGASCGLDWRTLNWNLDVYTAPLEEAWIQVQSRKKTWEGSTVTFKMLDVTIQKFKANWEFWINDIKTPKTEQDKKT